MSAVGATPNEYNRCRSLAFPSATDLFDVQPHTLIMSIYPGLAPFAIRYRSFRANSSDSRYLFFFFERDQDLMFEVSPL